MHTKKGGEEMAKTAGAKVDAGERILKGVASGRSLRECVESEIGARMSFWSLAPMQISERLEQFIATLTDTLDSLEAAMRAGGKI